MPEMISVCGMHCDQCEAYIATQENDDDKRAEVAKLWSKQFKTDIQTESINCDGCLSNGQLVGYCNVCGIRKCGTAKAIANCAYCEEYTCDELRSFLQMVPEAKNNLDQIRNSI